MPNGIIKVKAFERIKEVDVKLNILFETMTYHMEKIDKRFEAGSERFKKLENRKLVDRTWATIAGAITGFAASLGIKWSS